MILAVLRALIACAALYVAAMGNWWFLLSVLLLVAMFAFAAFRPWLDRQHQRNTPRASRPVHGGAQLRLRYGSIPGCTQCAEADPPPCDEHGARELANMPAYHPERVVYTVPNPQDFAALEALLTNEQPLPPNHEGTTHDREH